MQTCNIETLIYPDPRSNRTDKKKYQVHLGDFHTAYFTSEKTAKQYMARTGRLLTECVHEINGYLADLYSNMRTCWSYGKTDLTERIRELIEHSESNMDKLTKGLRENAFVFRFLRSTINCLTEAYELLTSFYRSRSQFDREHTSKRNNILCQNIWARIDLHRCRSSKPNVSQDRSIAQELENFNLARFLH
jgi:hypothetical protein